MLHLIPYSWFELDLIYQKYNQCVILVDKITENSPMLLTKVHVLMQGLNKLYNRKKVCASAYEYFGKDMSLHTVQKELEQQIRYSETSGSRICSSVFFT